MALLDYLGRRQDKEWETDFGPLMPNEMKDRERTDLTTINGRYGESSYEDNIDPYGPIGGTR